MSDIYPSVGQTDNLEHTDENHAKKVNAYVWNSGSGVWERQAKDLTPGTDFDYIDIQQTSSTVETYVYKQGGSGGSIVQTIVVTYTDSSKNDLDKVEYS